MPVTQLRLVDSMLLKRIQTAELLLAALLSLVFQTSLSQTAIAVSGKSLRSKKHAFFSHNFDFQTSHLALRVGSLRGEICMTKAFLILRYQSKMTATSCGEQKRANVQVREFFILFF